MHSHSEQLDAEGIEFIHQRSFIDQQLLLGNHSKCR